MLSETFSHSLNSSYFTSQGELVPTLQEANLRERQAKEEAQQRAEKLAEKLRSLGINPDEIE